MKMKYQNEDVIKLEKLLKIINKIKHMKQKIISWKNKLFATIHFRIFKELIFWAIIVGCYEIISLMVSAKDTLVNYIGFFFILVLITFVIKKLIDYCIQIIKATEDFSKQS